MTRLSVNLNKVALLRNARDLDIPCVTKAAQTCIAAGAHGITVHPRPDERHIRPADVDALADLLVDAPAVEFNIEGNPFEGRYMDVVRRVKPTQCTLVPDDATATTSDHGWDLDDASSQLVPIVRSLKDLGARVSVFLEPHKAQVELAAKLGTDQIELYTEPYASAFGTHASDSVLARYRSAAEIATGLGLGVNAGHDLNLHNLPSFCSVPGLLEVSIGHALIADALEVGLQDAVRAYLEILESRSGRTTIPIRP